MIMKQIISFLKKDIVMCISLVLAMISMFIVPPSKEYAHYIDFRTLSLLLCLMLVMAGFRSLGVFHQLGQVLLRLCHNTRQIALVLIGLCFFTSMLITNDVALITFIPFTIEILMLSNEHKLAIPIIVMQTIAANLGSMLTPLGNPQNLYLYSLSGVSLGTFIVTMLPYCILSLVGILLTSLLIAKHAVNTVNESYNTWKISGYRPKMILYTLLFFLCLLCVVRILPYQILLAIVLILIAILDKKNLAQADYALLFTFTFLFIFIGNLSNIDVINAKLAQVIQGHELLSGILASQVISNVPAAILLSGFTDNYHDLLISVNLGGLGTLIASMASLISFKQFCAAYGDSKLKYLFWFTLTNIAFLIVLYTYAYIVS